MIKRHGLKGDVKIHLDSPLPENLESIFVEIDNRLIPFFIQDVSILHDVAIIKFEDVEGPDQANKLVKSAVYLPNESKPKSESNELKMSDLIGFSVYSKKKNLGIISGINQHTLNPLLVVTQNETEMLIPISDYFIKDIDYKLKKVKVELPDGFTEI